MIDPNQLAAWRKLCKAATKGPWRLEDRNGALRIVKAMKEKWVCEYPFLFGKCDTANMAFIAAARTALPLLLDEVEALQAEVARLRGKS